MAKIEGRQRVIAKMRALGPETRKALAAALNKGAGQVVATAQAFVPVGETGDLRASIKAFPGGAPDFGTSGVIQIASKKPRKKRGKSAAANRSSARQATGAAITDPELTVDVVAGNSKTYYARFVEFGTSSTTPQPYFYPSVRLNKNKVKRGVAKAMREAARKTWAR
jgi:HK97 gp10 family phage protein